LPLGLADLPPSLIFRNANCLSNSWAFCLFSCLRHTPVRSVTYLYRTSIM